MHSHTIDKNMPEPASEHPATTANGINSREVILPSIVEPDGLILRERQLKRPAAHQVLVEIEASGISYAERSMRRGRYPGQPAFPFVPGYDLVGRVIEVGHPADTAWLGQRVAALTKTGGWASHTLLPVSDLLSVPTGIDPAQAEALVVNGLAAWQMLHRVANIQPGQTILVYGANGGVGTLLTQLARHQGLRVIGLASPAHHDRLRSEGVEPFDYNALDLAERISEVVPDGVDAVFDNVGGPSIARSFSLLRRGGILVSYALASAMPGKASLTGQFVKLLAQLFGYTLWPNGRRATFYHIWSGQGKAAFRERLTEDFGHLMRLLASGVLTPPIAARFPMHQVQAAMTLAESRTTYGKIILLP